MNKKHGTLVLVRHGESRFNELNLFTGWLDAPLSEAGLKEAESVAVHCAHFNYDAAFTSHLERAHETLLVILADQKKIGVFQHNHDRKYLFNLPAESSLQKKVLPVITTKELNERFYGKLQGMNKNAAMKKYGRHQVNLWRRSYDEHPPEGESLKEVFNRATAYFQKNIHSRVLKGETILVVAHGNTLRAIIKFLENIDDHRISSIDLPFAQPLVYMCEKKTFTRIEGKYELSRPLR